MIPEKGLHFGPGAHFSFDQGTRRTHVKCKGMEIKRENSRICKGTSEKVKGSETKKRNVQRKITLKIRKICARSAETCYEWWTCEGFDAETKNIQQDTNRTKGVEPTLLRKTCCSPLGFFALRPNSLPALLLLPSPSAATLRRRPHRVPVSFLAPKRMRFASLA